MITSTVAYAKVSVEQESVGVATGLHLSDAFGNQTVS